MEIPRALLEQPRWAVDSRAWLDALPRLIDESLLRWELALDGPAMSGSNGIVLPVRRGSDPLALKLTPPDSHYRDELVGLRFWDGRGTVRLLATEPGAFLLERLDARHSAAALPLEEAMPVLGRLMRRLAVPLNVSTAVPSTGQIAEERANSMPRQWRRLGEPFGRHVLEAAVTAARELATPGADTAVDGDLHGDQVLAGTREPWLAVDPVLLQGDPEYDLARILWTRLDEMNDDPTIRRHLDAIIEAAALEPARARAWARFRTVDYWLWGLENGLTEDPVRCARLFAALPE